MYTVHSAKVKSEGSKAVGSPRWEEYVNMDPTEIGLESLDWVELSQNIPQ
jgi:hypothetical protein